MDLTSLIREYDATRRPEDRGTFCHAPSVSLNFDQSGNATACCYNRRFILGTYPKHSLEEIWNGSQAQKLRELLRQGDLSHGCDLCRDQLAARNFAGLRAAFFDGKVLEPGLKASSTPMPRIMEFETSNTCNLECVMCSGYFSSSIRKNREKLEPIRNPYDDRFVEQLRPFIPYLSTARFLGGEPLLNPLYFKIWELISELNPAINTTITTNGTVLNEKGLRILRKLGPTLVLSCESLDKATYEAIRLGARYETMRENLETFLRIANDCGRPMSIAVCPMVNNWKGIPELLRFCNERGICIGFNTMVWPLELSLKTLPKAELARVVGYLEEGCPAAFRLDKRWWIRYNYKQYEGMLHQLRHWHRENAEAGS